MRASEEENKYLDKKINAYQKTRLVKQKKVIEKRACLRRTEWIRRLMFIKKTRLIEETNFIQRRACLRRGKWLRRLLIIKKKGLIKQKNFIEKKTVLKKKRVDKKTSAYWKDAVQATEELHRKAARAERRKDYK